ncbi:MAG: NAD+ synthase [Actinobacteria bacterium]|nr:NAD+ synthase [Actinomycetota bacterium]
MGPSLRVALCQLNTTVGDLEGNLARILKALETAEGQGAQLAVFPELAITGYPPEDLLLKSGFVDDALETLEKVVAATAGCAAMVGFVDRDGEGKLYNAAALCAGGTRVAVYRKHRLPNYSVFDEARYFEPGPGRAGVVDLARTRVGVAVCEDVWWPDGPLAGMPAAGAEVVVVLNASPYYARRADDREQVLEARAAEAGCPLIFVNQVGGQDELIFDGASRAVGADGQVRIRLPQFTESIVTVDVADLDEPAPLPPEGPTLTSEVYEALVLGTGDYARKNGFTDVVFGLSGGIDSSLVACVAADALGPEHVHAVALPSRYTADESNDYAAELAQNLGIDLRSIPIEPAYTAMLAMLGEPAEMEVGGVPHGLVTTADTAMSARAKSQIARENLQGRIRSALVWALNNKFNWLVLVCGNKSELAVGYTTAYGIDMAGGFAPIKDVWKTEIYALARERNRRAGKEVIPEAVIQRPPTAELRPGQLDQDSLPPYEVLDPILEGFVEEDRTATELIEDGHDAATVGRIVRMVDSAEWKRRQAPPGVRVSPKAFGRDRRMPITNKYRG